MKKTDFLLEQKEIFWINTLCTAYPLGLNDNIRGHGNISQGGIGDVYFTNSQIPRRKRGHGKRKNRKRILINRQFFIEKVELLKDKFESCLSEFYQTLRSFRKRHLVALSKHQFSYPTEYLRNIFQSFTNNVINPRSNIQEMERRKNRKQDREVLLIPFVSKAIDSLKLKSLFLDGKIQRLMPEKIFDSLPISLRHSYDIPIGRKICNYSSLLKGLGLQKLKEYIGKDCECNANVEHFYEPHGHVISGDLSLVQNPVLRDLMMKGTKYREPRFVKMEDLKQTISSSINNFLKKICSKYGLQLINFCDWKTKVEQVLSSRLSFLNSHKPWLFKETKPCLNFPGVKKELERLHAKYVICPVDKASNNYVFVCKKYYITVLMKELGMDFSSFACEGNETYSPVNDSYDSIIERHCKIMDEDFGITVNQENQVLPRIFWNPKLHKTPFKARFIAGATFCSTKQLSRFLTKALQVVLEHFRNYCRATYRKSGFNYDWGINSTKQFLDKLKQYRNNKGVFSAQIHDFSTLYTNFALDEVKTAMGNLFDLVFNENRKHINISLFRKRQFFDKKARAGYHTFDKKTLCKAINFILDNGYVVFGDFILRQDRGIIMGGSCSKEISECTLAWFEFSYMKNLVKKKEKRHLARLLSMNSRFVDDLISIDYQYFGNLYPEIYPEGLMMERCGNDNRAVNYLDLTIVFDGKGSFTSTIYCKQNDFNFSVIRYTFPSGNMPLEVGYNVFYGQVLRYAELCSEREDFMCLVQKLFKTLNERGYRASCLQRKFLNMLKQNPTFLLKFGFPDINNPRLKLV